MNAKLIALLALILIVLVIARTLTRRDKDHRSQLNLDDLLLGDDGKMSKAAAVMLGAFLVTTWMMVWLTLKGTMSEGYFGLYSAAWIAPTVTVLIAKRAPAAVPVLQPASTSIAVAVSNETKE